MMLCFILGTRPEIIKLSPVVRETQKNNLDFIIIHTNQHFSPEMDKIFFQELHLPLPKYNLQAGGGENHEVTIVRMLTLIKDVLEKEKPDLVIVQGDTNSTVAGALAATNLKIKVAHIEAGLRSYDQSMPEEYNRIVTDHVSHFLFAPTDIQKNILLEEGIPEDKIKVTGNTIVDAVKENVKFSIKGSKKNSPENYILLTMHRPSNVDNEQILRNHISNVEELSRTLGMRILFPVHPRTKRKIDQFRILFDSKLILKQNPVGYIEMLSLIKSANLIVTDSGGIQEESCILQKPCLTLREKTERPETVDVGASVLVGSDKKKLVMEAKRMLIKPRTWANPFGDGNAAQKIIKTIIRDL